LVKIASTRSNVETAVDALTKRRASRSR
jgi:hypothetical protein